MRHTLLYILLPVLVLLSVILTYCDRAEDQRLLRVERIVNDSLETATALFESINPDSLSELDRHLHDFLSVKIDDKNYVTHTSDSLILRVIDMRNLTRVTAGMPRHSIMADASTPTSATTLPP